MIEISTIAAVAAGAVLAVVVGGVGWALYQGLRLRRLSLLSEGQARQNGALLASSPALALIVRADGRVDAPDRLVDWLGLGRAPRFLADLTDGSGGLGDDDAAALARDVTATQRSGRPFIRSLRTQGSERVLLVRGQRAPEGVGSPGSVIAWFFDSTEAQAEIERLTGAQMRLQADYDALTALIEAAPMPMWHRGSDLRLTLVNTAYVAAVEARDAADAVTRQIELIERSDEGGPLARAALALKERKPVASRVPVTIAGMRRMQQVTDVPLGASGVAGYAVDIEDVESARGALRRFRDAQRDMLDRLSAGVAQFDQDRTLSYANQPFRRLFAMRPEWLADRPAFERVLERMRESERLPEVRDFPGWKNERREWFTATGGALEEPWLLPDGTHLRVVAQPLPEGGLLLIFEDRTEQVQLASSRDTLLRVRTATFDNLFEALGVFAADGRLQIWNNRFRETWEIEEDLLSSHPRIDALVDAIRPKLANPQRSRMVSELVRAATVERKQRGGRIAFADGRHFEFAAVPLPDGNALFTMLDITDSRRIERALRDRAEALEAADSLKTAFVSNMSYDLRTPLTSIAGFAEMLDGGYAGKLSAQAQDYVLAILTSVERLGQMIDDVLDMTQSDAGALPLDRQAMAVEKVVRGAAETQHGAAKGKEIDLVCRIEPSAGEVMADGKRLGQAVANLLRHALTVTPVKGRVLVHADGTADAARIVVSDNGPGMTPAEVARAFDRFAQVGPAGEQGARGLDLPLARQFVEAHGGRIAIESEPGLGTMMSIELPRA